MTGSRLDDMINRLCQWNQMRQMNLGGESRLSTFVEKPTMVKEGLAWRRNFSQWVVGQVRGRHGRRFVDECTIWWSSRQEIPAATWTGLLRSWEVQCVWRR